MTNLDKLYEYIDTKDTVMVMIINNNSKPLLDSLCNKIYNNYKKSKVKISTRKGLFKKLIFIKEKLIRVDFDFDSINFNGTTNLTRRKEDLSLIRSSLIENKSKLLCRVNLYFDFNKNLKNNLYSRYYEFDLVILINKEEIEIIKSDYHCVEKHFSLDQLIRKTKLDKIKNNLFLYN